MPEINQNELKDRLIEQLTQELGVLRTNLAYQNLVIEALQGGTAHDVADTEAPAGYADEQPVPLRNATANPDLQSAPVQSAPNASPVPDVQGDINPNLTL